MRDPSRERRVADLLSSRFELVQFLGEGGFASVYQVVNRKLGRIEALKVLHASHTDEADFARRFEQEARVAASLDHPNIVKIFDYGQADELFWFTMQFVGGPTLHAELKKTRTFPCEVGVRIAVAVLDALDYSHRRGVVHRDVKPENVILDDERRPYLMDFGIAKSETSLVRTQTGTVLGSPAYIAPEQLTGALVDGRADLFALGVTLYRMLTGAFPFSRAGPALRDGRSDAGRALGVSRGGDPGCRAGEPETAGRGALLDAADALPRRSSHGANRASGGRDRLPAPSPVGRPRGAARPGRRGRRGSRDAPWRRERAGLIRSRAAGFATELGCSGCPRALAGALESDSSALAVAARRAARHPCCGPPDDGALQAPGDSPRDGRSSSGPGPPARAAGAHVRGSGGTLRLWIRTATPSSCVSRSLL